MEKATVGKVTAVVVGLIFILFWRSTFSIRIMYDSVFFIIYALALFVIILIFRIAKKQIIYISLSIILCVGTVVSIVAYRSWNKAGFYINVDSVEKIVFRDNDKEYVVGDDEESINRIVKGINKAYCIKKWENQGELCTSSQNLNIVLDNGDVVSIDSMGCVRLPMGKWSIYRIDYDISDFAE